MGAQIVVDSSELKQLAAQMMEAKRALVGRLGERGYQLLRDEVPVEFGNLKQGVGAPEVDYEKSEAVLTVTARSAATGSGVAEVFGADGKLKKTVSLRPQPAYNYADVIARGNKEATLTPKTAHAFLIPVTSAPSGEGYLLIGGKAYVLRRTKKGMKPNPFDERSAKRLADEAPRIADAVLKEFV